MKLVPENINEAVKHLSPKSEEEVQEYLKKLSPDDKIMNGVMQNDINLLKLGIEEGGNVNKFPYLPMICTYPSVAPDYDFACKALEALLTSNVDKIQIEEALQKAIKNKSERMILLLRSK